MDIRAALEECAVFLRKCESNGAPGAIQASRAHLDVELGKMQTAAQIRNLAESVLTDFNMLAPKFREYNFKDLIAKLNVALKNSI